MAGPTHRRTWQKAEQRAAALLGAKRNPGSGSQGREDLTASDSTHERVFLECKLRPQTFVRSLLEECREKARREGKVPVVALFDKGKPGCLFCVHSGDLEAFAREVLAAAEARRAAGAPDTENEEVL